MVQEISKHTKDPKTVETIGNGTYVRSRPKTIYGKHSASLEDFFGDEWQKKAQNAVVQYNEGTQQGMKKSHGIDGKINIYLFLLRSKTNFTF